MYASRFVIIERSFAMNVSDLKHMLTEISQEESYPIIAKMCRQALIAAIDFIYEAKAVKKPKDASLIELVDSVLLATYVNDTDLINTLHYVRTLGKHAEQNRSVSKKESKLAFDNITYFIGFIEAKENGTVHQYKKPLYMSEEATRRIYVDSYLKEAGWEILDTKNLIQPSKAGIEIEVDGMPNNEKKGYCDYVLYGENGKPLAIVEVKKTSIDPAKGRHQVDLYGECMKAVYGYKPVLYYTNGYITKIIDGIYPDRTVMAFHTMKELTDMIKRRDRGNITDLKINDEITNRPYQKMAITNICEWLNSNHRRGLLVMATGTGKTRVAISLVDILTRNKWITNVLFLADRTSLVSQAKRNFEKHLPNQSFCELSGKDTKDFNARMMFCTYQTMINYIDAEDKRFTSGRFDLIIIDEAHRSIFNKYGSIFKYFDSFLVGLTATPKDEVDANTYRIFGCEAGIPNFDYRLEDAVREKYLVGYHVINRTSKLMREGIKYNELSEEEKEQIDNIFVEEDTPTPEFEISGSEMFKQLYNKDTCCKVLEDLMRQGLRVNSGETLGKTIIFAYNHKHAQMIVDCFWEMYPDHPANTCQLVDYSVNYADDLVLKFESDEEFRIAVSVDMLDTGIDVTSVLNLVFFKPVKSKIKFVQMIGRGTRLCENIYGQGKHKSEFYIFDYCGNFEYFDIHPEGREGKTVTTLSQRQFNVRIEMLYELQRIEFQERPWYRAYYERIRDMLYGDVVKIKSHGNRIQVRESMQYVDKYYNVDTWVAISPVIVSEAKKHISPLLDSGVNGDHMSVSFDVRMYNIERAILKNGNIASATEDVKTVRQIAQYLLKEKASVPIVLAKASALKELRSEELWSAVTVEKLEELREAVRDLMQFLKGEKNLKFDIDIEDVVTDSDYIPEDTFIDIRTYREKVIDYLAEHSDSEVIKKIYNLEPVNNEDLEELEKILWKELGTKEEYAQTTTIGNLAAFIRSLIGLSQEAVNDKFGEYLSGNVLNSQQQEFIKTIINYVRENGDIEVADIVNTEPFNNYDINEMFGENVPIIVKVVTILHSSVAAA